MDQKSLIRESDSSLHGYQKYHEDLQPKEINPYKDYFPFTQESISFKARHSILSEYYNSEFRYRLMQKTISVRINHTVIHFLRILPVSFYVCRIFLHLSSYLKIQYYKLSLARLFYCILKQDLSFKNMFIILFRIGKKML